MRWARFSRALRYSCRHSHSPALHQPFQADFAAAGDAPLPLSKTESAASAPGLSPDGLSARGHSTSELLRTLSRVAASKPTSWPSGHPHIL